VTLIVVSGTGTEVGKTYVAAALARALRSRGIAVHARKPVQSFDPADTITDAHVLAAATGEPDDVICPPHRRYAAPMAPPMAAEVLQRPSFTTADLAHELDAPANGVTLVEGAGGLCSPLATDGDTLALIERCNAALVVLVADAGLGTINLVRLCMTALDARPGTHVFLNRFDAGDNLHRRNAHWLRTREGLDVVTNIEALSEIAVAATR
jgi:dethiobiotin synthetase